MKVVKMLFQLLLYMGIDQYIILSLKLQLLISFQDLPKIFIEKKKKYIIVNKASMLQNSSKGWRSLQPACTCAVVYSISTV